MTFENADSHAAGAEVIGAAAQHAGRVSLQVALNAAVCANSSGSSCCSISILNLHVVTSVTWLVVLVLHSIHNRGQL